MLGVSEWPDTTLQRRTSQLQPQNNLCQVRKKIQNYSFVLSDRIGKGYSSVVYRGLNDLTGQTVAVKVIELRSLRDQTSKFMLQTEIECFKQTQHPNLLRYHNSFYTVNNCYIVTEYCSKGDLAKIIKEKGAMNEQDAAKLFKQIYKGYQHFYSVGFIHRDIKPANIFVAADGTLRIADFGFCKKRTQNDRENYNVGTPIYMPRQSLNANIYNQKTDIWALGITLYQMVFGHVPFRGKSQAELKAQIQRGFLNFPDNHPISSQLKDFLRKCLHSDPIQRIGLREIGKHSWMIQKQNKQSFSERLFPLESAGRQCEEKQVRISLPNEGMAHNRSRQYFQKLPLGLQNRRSISSMQKLKLCHPKKNSQILSLPRQPLVNRSVGSININLPEKQKHRQTDYIRDTCEDKQNLPCGNRPSLPSSTAHSTNSLQVKNIKQQQISKFGIEKIVSLINYFRLLYKISQKIGEACLDILDSDIKSELIKLDKLIIGDLRYNFQKHLSSIQAKQNHFHLDKRFWGEFITSERWKMYSFVIKQYEGKYKGVLNGQINPSIKDIHWRPSFISFYDTIKNLEVEKVLLVKERYALCEVNFYLETLVQMNQLAHQSGWQDFTQLYSAQQFVPFNFSITIANYYEIQERVKAKYDNLKSLQLAH